MSDAPPPILGRLRGALAALWRTSRATMLDRVSIVDDAAMRLLDGQLSSDERRDAERAAHQLAGTCGTFGFVHATDLAREGERLLAGDAPIGPNAVYRLAQIAVALREQLTEELPGARPEDQFPRAAAAERGEVAAGDDGDLILALDDDADALQIVSTVLVPAGYRVMATSDPYLFLELLASAMPSLVILDIDMPEMSGVEMCRRLRADRRWRTLPVLFLTGRSDADSVARLFTAGADDYAVKPVEGPELVARIRNRLERSRLPRSVAPSVAYTVDVAVVEDDRVLVGLLEQSLATGGYSTASFPDGPAAVEALTTRDGVAPAVRARVIVLDVGLPGMDGLAVLRALSRQGIAKRSRVVMLTARTSEEEVVQALELGAFDHVTKPFSVPVLLQRIRRAFDAGETGG